MKRRGRVDENGSAFHGSQHQIQLYVNEHAALLSAAIKQSDPTIPSDAEISWVSPLQNKHYQEYWDSAFLDALALRSCRDQLADFWPRGGPHWDALAKINHAGTPGAILVEAKAHPTEIYNEKGAEASPESLRIIESSLSRTCEWLNVRYGPFWTGSLYQSANRLAHLYFLREIARVDAWLVNIYFLNDKNFRPTSQEEWMPALAQVKTSLGIADISVPYSSEVFLPAFDT